MAIYKSVSGWRFMKKIPYGHSFWMHTETGRISMADDSALDRYHQHYGPEACDDGIMYLDFSRDLTVSTPAWADWKLVFNIPIVSPVYRAGAKNLDWRYLNSNAFNQSNASGGAEEGSYLMETFNWQVAIGNKLYSRKFDTDSIAEMLSIMKEMEEEPA